jgi:FtsZ-binding cell division protein ZapB
MDLKDITPESVGGTAVGASMLWLFFKKLLLRNAVDNAAINAADAQGDVITLLRNEVNRLAERVETLERENTTLRDKLNIMTERLNSVSRRSDHLDLISDTNRCGGS